MKINLKRKKENTGMVDRGGMEILEGDVLKCFNEYYVVRSVIYGDSEIWQDLHYKDSGVSFVDLKRGDDNICSYKDVVGNVWDSEELKNKYTDGRVFQ